MDWQVVVNIVALITTLSGGIIGWWTNVIWTGQKELRDDIRAIETNLPTSYVKKDELRDVIRDLKDEHKDDMREIKDMLKQIFNKLDNKADK